jgi:DNA-binding CsgD family transcriptional regulator
LAFFAAHVELMRRYAAHYWDPALAQEHATQAQRAAFQTPPGSVISFIEMQMALNAFSGRPAEARALAQFGVDCATRDGDLLSAIRCWSNFAAVMEGAGETDQSDAGSAMALELVQRSALDSLTGYWMLVERAYAKFNRGDLQGARELVDRLLAANVELPTFRLYVARVGIPIGLRLDLDELVARCTSQYLVDHALHASVPAIVGITAAFAEGLDASGKTEAARSLLGKAIDILERTHAQPPPGDADLLLVAVAKYGLDPDVSRARTIFERIVRDSAVHSSPAFFALFEAYEARRAGDRERVETKANEAAKRFKEIGWPLHQAAALEVAGHFEKALALYRECGDERDARRLDAKLNPVNRRGRAKSELTGREREICDLLTKGKTNKAIAEELVVSERTVESHVSSILTKMSVSSRAELIARLKT